VESFIYETAAMIVSRKESRVRTVRRSVPLLRQASSAMAANQEFPGRGFRHACGAPGHLYGKCDGTQNVLSGRIAAIRAANRFK
jgi:hypothetical protein